MSLCAAPSERLHAFYRSDNESSLLTTSLTWRLLAREYFSSVMRDLDANAIVMPERKRATRMCFAAHKFARIRYAMRYMRYSSRMAQSAAGKIAA